MDLAWEHSARPARPIKRERSHHDLVSVFILVILGGDDSQTWDLSPMLPYHIQMCANFKNEDCVQCCSAVVMVQL